MTFKPRPVKTTFISNDGIPGSVAGTSIAGPFPTHGGDQPRQGGSGSSTKECLTANGGIVRDSFDCLKVDWSKALGEAQVCSTDVINCSNP